MPYTKKILIFTLSTLLVGGGAWYAGDIGIFDGLSSSVLNSSYFPCTETNLQSQKALYERTITRKKKAFDIRTTLSDKITQLESTWAEPTEITKQQALLKKLTKQMLVYSRFISKYETCTREIHLKPQVTVGIMSGEAQVVSSVIDYQELAAFDITSPENLDVFMSGLEFQVRLSSVWNIVVDNWFLLSDTAAPISCGSGTVKGEVITVNCGIPGEIPVGILRGSKGAYRLGAHIISVAPWSGSIDIKVSSVHFNDGRSDFVSDVVSHVIRYGETTVPSTSTVPLPVPAITEDTAPAATGETDALSESSMVVMPPVDSIDPLGVSNGGTVTSAGDDAPSSTT